MTSVVDLVIALGPPWGLLAIGVVLVNAWIVRIAAIVWINRCYLRWTPSQRRDVRDLISVLKGRRGSKPLVTLRRR